MNRKIRAWLYKIDNNEQGDILVLALVMMILVSLIVGPLLNHMSTGMKNSREVYSVRTNEQYAADAGVAQAMWYIKYQNSNVPESFTVSSVNGKNAIVSISAITNQDSSVEYTISSRAGSTTTSAVIGYIPEVEAVPGIPGRPSVNLFNSTVTALNGNVTFNAGNARITGDTFVNNGRIVFPSGGSNQITGNAYSAGGVTGRGTITGSQLVINSGSTVDSRVSHPNATTTYATKSFTRPDAQMTTLKQQIYNLTYNINTPAASGSSITTPVSNKGSSSSYYHYTGAVNMTGDLSFTSSNYIVFDQQVCVGGNIIIDGNAYITFNGGVKITGQLQMTSGGGTVTFNGTLTAGSINYSNGMTLALNNNVKVLGNFNPGSGGSMNIAGTLYVGGNLTVTGGRIITACDAVYVVGDISLQNGAYIINSTAAANSHNKVIIANGNISMSGGTALGNTNQIPLIIDLNTSATITMNQGAVCWAALYAPDSAVLLAGNAQVTGAVVAKNITLGDGSGSPGITYLSGLIARTDLQTLYSDPGTPDTPGVAGSPESWGLNSWNIR
jgi:hypothetical protein